LNESATCQAYVLPKLQLAGWDPDRIVEQYIFTDGRIVVAGNKTRRQKKLRADYLLRYTRDYPLAVVEAKKELKTPDQGLQQAKRYAEVLGLKFAYATNGHGIVEFDYYTGEERFVDTFPTPDELWARLRKGEGLDDDDIVQKLLTPSYMGDKEPRYYQQIAINRTLQKILQGEKRVLLTMATGTGKTQVAFQICWKLWNARWNRSGKYKRPKILYLADRNILIDRPKDLDFAPFDEARDRIQNHFIN